MSSETVEIVRKIQAPLLAEDVIVALDDERMGQILAATFSELAAPDFEVVMIGPDYLPTTQGANGLDGFAELWRDWTSPFETFRIELDELIDAGDAVVSLVRQIGVTKTGGAEIETPAAAVWTIRDGLLRRVEFHLRREAAFRAAGLDDSNVPD